MDPSSQPLAHMSFFTFTVSANPVGPLPRGAEMTLICQVSSPLPSNAHLCWERVNGTQMDVKKSKQHEAKLEVNVSSAGLWNCHLIEDNDRKISLNYPVGMEISITSLPPRKNLKILFVFVSKYFSSSIEEAPVWTSYVVIGAIIGGSVLVFGLACLCIINGISWQRRRVSALVPVKGEEVTVSPDHRRSLIFCLSAEQNRLRVNP